MTETAQNLEPLDFDGSSGLDAILEQEAQQKAARSGQRTFLPNIGQKFKDAQGNQVQFLAKDGDRVPVRFFYDLSKVVVGDRKIPGLITTIMHRSIPTSPEAPLKKIDVPCRLRPPFASRYTTCPPHDMISTFGKKSSAQRIFGICIPQVEVIEGGKFVGWTDLMRTYTATEDGKEVKKTEPDYRIAEFANEKGWETAIAAAKVVNRRDPTILVGVWWIERKYTSTNTKYNMSPDDPSCENDKIKHPETGELAPVDLRDPAIRDALYPDIPDMGAILSHMASDEELGRMFGTGASSTAGTAADVPEESLAALAAMSEPMPAVDDTAARASLTNRLDAVLPTPAPR